jgi:peptide/nickel transport system substrate-binding protein
MISFYIPRSLFLCTYLWVAVSIILGCGGTPPPPTVFTMAIAEEPSTLDLHRTSEGNAAEVFQYVCEPLVYQDAQQTYQPLLAEAWNYAEDGSSLEITIKSNIRFHNGAILDANAVGYTFHRLQKEQSLEAPLYDRFQGVEIEVVDERTVRLVFPKPTYDFLSVLNNPYAAIIAPSSGENNTFATKPICTGPFQVYEWFPSEKIVLSRFDEYAWGPNFLVNQGAPHLSEIEIYFMETSEVRFAAFLNGELDLLNVSTPEDLAKIRADNQSTLYENFISGITFVGFNFQHLPTSELLVRQALAHAIDKQSIIDTVLPGMAVPANSPLAPTISGYDEAVAEVGYHYDPITSIELLEQAGFHDTNGDGVRERDGQPLRLQLLTTDSNTYNKIFTLLQSQFQAVGVQVELRAVPTEQIAEITPTGEFDLLLYHYNWGAPDALKLFLGSDRIGASNRVAYSNARVDSLVDASLTMLDNDPQRLRNLMEAQTIILQDAPWQPLLVRKRTIAVNTNVVGFQLLPSGQIWFNDVQMVTTP